MDRGKNNNKQPLLLAATSSTCWPYSDVGVGERTCSDDDADADAAAASTHHWFFSQSDNQFFMMMMTRISVRTLSVHVGIGVGVCSFLCSFLRLFVFVL